MCLYQCELNFKPLSNPSKELEIRFNVFGINGVKIYNDGFARELYATATKSISCGVTERTNEIMKDQKYSRWDSYSCEQFNSRQATLIVMRDQRRSSITSAQVDYYVTNEFFSSLSIFPNVLFCYETVGMSCQKFILT